MNGDVEWGGTWRLSKNGDCDAKNLEEIVNEDEAYILWGEYCFPDAKKGCLCMLKVPEGMKIVPPGKNGDCPKNSGPLLEPDALKAGAVALKCADEICEPATPCKECKECKECKKCKKCREPRKPKEPKEPECDVKPYCPLP